MFSNIFWNYECSEYLTIFINSHIVCVMKTNMKNNFINLSAYIYVQFKLKKKKQARKQEISNCGWWGHIVMKLVINSIRYKILRIRNLYLFLVSKNVLHVIRKA